LSMRETAVITNVNRLAAAIYVNPICVGIRIIVGADGNPPVIRWSLQPVYGSIAIDPLQCSLN
jgi:hypothetical protein